jgi:hypothetical protein
MDERRCRQCGEPLDEQNQTEFCDKSCEETYYDELYDQEDDDHQPFEKINTSKKVWK